MKVKMFYLCLLIVLLFGCRQLDDKISSFSYGPVEVKVFEKDAFYERFIKVYHRDGIVSKMEIVDKTIFDNEDIELMNSFDIFTKSTFEDDTFQVDGITQFSIIEDNIYTSTIILEYNTIDMDAMIKNNNWFVNAKDIVNDKLEVVYSKLERIIIDDGYTLID